MHGVTGNPSTVISVHLAVKNRLTLKVFDPHGREMATLVEGEMAAGSHAVTFAPQGEDWAGGLYFYKRTVENFRKRARRC